jgi:hypothetical protein
MAFVPNYEHDIFVSYAHIDNEPLVGAKEGWVTTLISSMKTRLAQRLGRSDNFSLWMDYNLLGHKKVTPQIQDALEKTATMVIVLSPGYIESEWCNRERDAFLDLVKKRDGSRVFIIERDVIDGDNRPPELTDLKGYRFWNCDREGKAPRIFGTPVPTKDDPEYYQMVDDLTLDLANELRSLKAAEDQPGTVVNKNGSFPEKSLRPKVFLAQVTDDLEGDRNNVKRYLNQLDVRVLPDTWYSLDPAKFREAVGRDLAECDLFVQMLSNFAGKKPTDLPQGYVMLQLEMARAANKSILQWRSPSLDIAAIEDNDHKTLIESNTVRAEGLEDFKRAIQNYVLEKVEQQPKPQPEPQPEEYAFVFLDIEVTDRPLADKVCAVLDRRGIGYSLPAGSEDSAENRRDLEQNLLDSAGVIIVYGSSTKTWVRSQLLECRKILATRKSPLPAFAVFEGPPEPKQSIDLKLPKLQILNCRKGFDEKELTSFLDNLK